MRERQLIVQSTYAATATVYDDQVPALNWPDGAGRKEAIITMAVNFLRLGVPAVQILGNYGEAEKMLKAMALPGETFHCANETYTRVINK